MKTLYTLALLVFSVALTADSKRFAVGAEPPPLPNADPRPVYDGPYVQPSTDKVDTASMLLLGTMVTRTNIYWMSQTSKVGTVPLVFAGSTNYIQIFRQTGRVSTGPVALFEAKGKPYDRPLDDWKDLGLAYRFFYMDGTKQVILTNSFNLIRP